ncbi:uncharacterized protein [Drosophila tropicalis]|uniref:uncharacterized protein n=1 Tax=Drosophila tropicalis TaxID=46794 RepID=UPI0035AB7B7B
MIFFFDFWPPNFAKSNYVQRSDAVAECGSIVGTRKRVQNQGSTILNSSAIETRCATMDENNSDPTSEVGYGPLPSTVDASWKTIMELQNKNLIVLVRAIQSTASGSAVQNKSAELPKFNPDKSGANASSWCTTVEIILQENALKGSALIMALSSALEGSTSQWLSQVCYAEITGAQRFDTVETPAAMFLSMLSNRPNDSEWLAVHVSRMVTELTTKWRQMGIEETAVSVTVALLASFDNRLQRLSFTSSVKTRSDLQSELKAFTLNKRKSGFLEH